LFFSPPTTTKKKTKAAGATKPKTKGFVLSMDVMKTLGELGVSLPTSDDATKETVEELKSKLGYYKENQARVTQDVLNPPTPPNRLFFVFADFLFLEHCKSEKG
jgi:hypothetical protein